MFDRVRVLWLGDEVIPGSPELIDFLIKNNKRVIVLTNNATKSRAVYADKLASLGFNRQLDKNFLVNPAAVIADALYRAGIAGYKKVYLIGAQGVRDEMDALGIEYFGHGPEPLDTADGSTFMYDIDLEVEPSKVGAVVIGYERHFNYHKLMKATNYLKQRHCLFLATNEDETCPGPNPDVVIPDAGPIVAAVRCASGREPLTVGKPNSPSFDYIRRRWNIEPERTMMVGDRTNTDVKFGRDHGLKTLLVLSGCHQLEDIMDNHKNDLPDMIPDYFATCLGALLSRGQN
ncbi:phosphoglycolate/pyridoxal phosphate phosphatase family protein [Teladorsagia circumcincta]|uniref:Phosphoglycolate/pyridoxal phosphate phosphatase family protein n=1 Tax=Teladorsagia circumcincta TaxID=45464 RepID=A0A2G9V3P4_TELCI|nr:phosphoglycolate/pyridoxal phosphate phosphatase family protein [Teladorsagia circumcincta]